MKPGPHFGITCVCGIMGTAPIRCDQMDAKPADLPPVLPRKYRRALAAFWEEHKACEGAKVASVVNIQPLGEEA